MEIKSIIESCTSGYNVRPTISELASLDFWTSNEVIDKQPVALVSDNTSLANSQISHPKLNSKQSLMSTKSGSIKESKRISETIDRIEK
jgi:hypothetical protein